MDKPQYLLYFSHSWLPQHVDANLAFWAHLWEDCLLLADDNTSDHPPYLVSRLEYLIRRSDAFIALVAPPDQTAGPHAVSPFVSFEIALAERAQLPRLIVYDKNVDLAPPAASSENVRYLQVTLSDLKENVWRSVADWLRAVTTSAPPRSQTPHTKASAIVPKGPRRDEILRTIETTLRANGYHEVTDVLSASNDAEMLAILRSTDLLVADVGTQSVWDVYGLAHALAVPTVRFRQTTALPAILGGHQEGYQRDVIQWTTPDEFRAAVALHAAAIRHAQEPVDTWEEGQVYFERRRATSPTPDWT